MTCSADKIRNYSGVIILALLANAALFGDAPANIASILPVITFLAISENVIQTRRQSRFTELSVIYGLWILFYSAISLFPKHLSQESLHWIRFPIYGFALSIWLLVQYKTHQIALLATSPIMILSEIRRRIYYLALGRKIFSTIANCQRTNPYRYI